MTDVVREPMVKAEDNARAKKDIVKGVNLIKQLRFEEAENTLAGIARLQCSAPYKAQAAKLQKKAGTYASLVAGLTPNVEVASEKLYDIRTRQGGRYRAVLAGQDAGSLTLLKDNGITFTVPVSDILRMDQVDPAERARFPGDFKERCCRLRGRDYVSTVAFPGPFWQIREWVGFERLCTMFIDDPDWLREMVEFWTRFVSRTLAPLLATEVVDHVLISEDMAYKQKPMISPAMARQFAENVDNINRMHVALGYWVAENTASGTVVALNDIGAITYIAERRVVDLAGLVTPEVTPSLRSPEQTDQLVQFMAEQGVEYVIVFPNWFPGLAERSDVLEEVHRVTLEDRSISGGETMVVYRANWQR